MPKIAGCPGRNPALPSIRARLALVVLACIIPAILGFALLIIHCYQRESGQINQATLLTTRALMLAVDRDLNNGKVAAQALATSPNLDRNDLAAFYMQAKSLLNTDFPGFTFILSNSKGQQLINTLRPFGQPLPPHGNPVQLRRVFATGLPVISDVYPGEVLHRPVIGIDVPVWRHGKVVYDLTVGIQPEHLDKILAEQRIPPERIAAIFDTKGVIAARTRDPQRYVGHHGTAQLLASMQQAREGEADVLTLDGVPTYSLFSRSPVTGWAVAIGIPERSILAELWQSLIWISIGTMALLAVGVSLAWFLGGNISRSVRALAAPLSDNGEMPHLQMSFREADEVARELQRHRLQLEQLVSERTAQLEKSRAMLETVYATAPAGLCFIGPDMRFLAVNQYLAAINGKPAVDHIGHTLTEIIGAMGIPIDHACQRVLQSGEPVLNMEVCGMLPASPQQQGYWLVSYYPAFGPRHEILGANGVVLDISERKRHEAIQEDSRRQLESQLEEIYALQQRLQEQVIRDPLTGLFNRRFLDEAMPRELVRAKREGFALTLIMIDLDNFKRVNDTYGHAAGDEVLKTLAVIMQKGARESDLICRYGGEEFLVALPGMQPEMGWQRAEIWRKALAASPVRHGDFMITTTLSAGVAGFPDHGIDIDTVLSRADEALYRAKGEGRDRVLMS